MSTGNVVLERSQRLFGSSAGTEVIPGPRAPKVWQFLRWISNPVGYAETCQARYGPLFGLRVFLFGRIVFASDPADVKTILTDAERFQAGEISRRLLEPLVGTNTVLTSTGEAHLRQRKLLLPPMHQSLVERWSDRIEAIAAAELDRVPLGAPVAMRPPMQAITLEVICRLVFGAERPAQMIELREALARSLSFSKLTPLLFFPKLFDRPGRLNPAAGFLRQRKEVHRVMAALIDERRRSADLNSRDDVLSLLIRAGEGGDGRFTDEELRDQLMTLLIAGHETTATAIAWSLERLSRNPHARERLAASVLADEEEYLNAVIQETLRVRPPIVNVPRTTTAPVELGGRRLGQGVPVAAMLALAHRRADLWANPLEFTPERFLDGKPAPYSFTPFGGGIRRCIGASLALLEMRVVLRAIIRRFAIEPAPGREEKIRLIGPVLAPSKGGRVILRGRG